MGVSNIEKSIDFYVKYFNLRVERVLDEEGHFLEHLWNEKKVKVKSAKLSDEKKEICVEFLELKSFNSVKQNTIIPRIFDIGPSHFAFTVKNIENLYITMKKDNVKFLNKPITSIDGKAKVFFCKDPDGILIELVEQLTD